VNINIADHQPIKVNLFLASREEHGLRVLRRIFGSTRDEVTGSWKNLHNEELNNFYCSSSIIRIFKPRDAHGM
jgi:hypothetical protein